MRLLLRIRTRRFAGRCTRHKRYNPAVDGRGGVRGGCFRCSLLADIYELSMKLNGAIRRFDPRHDDLQRPPREAPRPPDPRQLSLLEGIAESDSGGQ
jgi:hypothetical protein